MSPAASLNNMLDIPHYSLLTLTTKAHQLMPSLPPPHVIPHMPLLAAYSLKDRLLPRLSATVADPAERVTLQRIHLSTFYVLAVVIAACGPRPLDFRMTLAGRPEADVVPTLFDPICRAAGVSWLSIRKLVGQRLGSTASLVVRVKCDAGDEERMIPPAAFLQVTEVDRFGRERKNERAFSAGAQEEDWVLEQVSRRALLREEYVDMRDVVPDDVLFKFEMPLDDDLVLSHNTYTYDHPIWPALPSTPIPARIPTPHPIEPPRRPEVVRAPSTDSTDSYLAPPMSRGSSALTDPTLATPSIMCLSPLTSRASSPMPGCGKQPYARTPSPIGPVATPKPADAVTVRVEAGERVRMLRLTTLPVQRYEGGNVLVRGSGLLLGTQELDAERRAECEVVEWKCEEACEYVEDSQSEGKAEQDQVFAFDISAHSRRPSVLELDLDRTPTPAAYEDAAVFPAFKLHLAVEDPDSTVPPLPHRPISELIRLPAAPPCVPRAVPCAGPEAFSPSSSSASLTASMSYDSLSGTRKKRGKRGGKQVQARKARAMEVAAARAGLVGWMA